MRISTNQIQTIGINSILDQQSRLSKTQQQVALGKRVMLPSDDPVATTQMLNLQQALDTTSTYQTNANAAVSRLSQEDGILDAIGEILQRARELAVEGKNGSQTNETRKFIATEVRQRLDELIGLANTKDGTGDYLFSGGLGSTQPFARVGATFTYSGDQTQRFVQISSGRQVADGDAGSTVFQLIRNGNGTFVTGAGAANTGTGTIDTGSVSGTFTPTINTGVNGFTVRMVAPVLPGDPMTWEAYATGDATETPFATGTYTDGQAITLNGAKFTISGSPAVGDTFDVRSSENQDLFTTLENLATALEAPGMTASQQAQMATALDRSLSDLDQGIGNVLVVRSSVGSRLNAIESQQYVNDGAMQQTTEVLSSIKDLDYAEAISRLNQQLAGLQASQQAYIKVNGLSMFNFLK
jgi:flagellar hook-associated protein 3 FlgL